MLLQPFVSWAAPKRFQWTTQLGVTQADYSEPALGASSSQIGLHLKQGVSYSLVQDRFDLYLGAYINGMGELISAKQTLSTGAGESKGGPTYWGISGRAPLSIVKKSSRWDLRIAPGYSIWGMGVQDDVYGIKLLAAPTLHFAFRNRKNGTRQWGFSFKLSPLSANAQTLSSNRELAAGLDVQLNSSRAKRPLLFTFDYSDTQFALSTGSETREGSFISLSAGLALRW